jgi:RNA polymerase sporulation-specific sigma factor
MTKQTYLDNDDLLKQYKEGKQDIKQQLVMNNMPLVYNICKRFANRGTDLEDLYQIGAIGLIRAIELFDPTFNVKFSTYAVPMVIGEIKKYLRDSTTLKVSRSYKELSARVYMAKQELFKKAGKSLV